MKILIPLLIALSVSAQSPSVTPPLPPDAAVDHAFALRNIPKERIAYEVMCQNPRCLAISTLKPAREFTSMTRSVEGGLMVQSSAQFKCPKCRHVIYEQLPEHFVPHHPARLVVLPEKKPFLKRLFTSKKAASAQ